MGMVYELHVGKYDALFGGRHHCLITMFEEFFIRLNKLGVKIVFFIDGTIPENKLPLWIKRKNEKYLDQMNIYDKIKEKNYNFYSKWNLRISGVTTVATALIETCKRFGEFHTSFYNECDNEVALYANKHNAMAIFASDTDYYIFDGDWAQWSPNINFDNFSTIAYNRKGVRTLLNLKSIEMPLFAALCGNDVLSELKIKRFDKDLHKNMFKKAEYVRSLNLLNVFNLSDKQLKSIAQVLFDFVDDEHVSLLRNSINFYDMNAIIDEPLQHPQTLINNLGFLYNLLIDKPSNISLNYIDFRIVKSQLFTENIKLLTKRQMGILLQHKQDPMLTRRIVIKPSHIEPPKEFILYAEYPSDGKTDNFLFFMS